MSDAAVVLIGPHGGSRPGWADLPTSRRCVRTSGALVERGAGRGRPLHPRTTAGGAEERSAPVLGVPIRGRDERIGVVVLGRARGGAAFTAGDEKLLLAVAGEAGVAYDRARLHEQEVGTPAARRGARGRPTDAAEPAARVDARTPGWEFAAIYQAAREVGGDFYDFVETRRAPGSLDLVIGDVTGKGVPAAL